MCTESEESFDYSQEYAYLASLSDLSNDDQKSFALLEFDHPTVVAPNSRVLGSRLDTDVHTTSCRLAFEGHILTLMSSESYKQEELQKLKVFKLKEKCGVIERANSDMELIGKGMFKKETNIHIFDGFSVVLSNGSVGKLDGPFGQSGKFKIRLEGIILYLLQFLTTKSFFTIFNSSVVRGTKSITYKEKEDQRGAAVFASSHPSQNGLQKVHFQ